jgi:AraC family transcriptional regulator
MARRVSRAQHFLIHTDMRLDDIAAACGFHDQAHMARAIRAATGLSPLELRQAGR